jgi:hypothetical protein
VDLLIYELVFLQAKQEKTVKAVASLGNKLELLRQRMAGLQRWWGRWWPSSLPSPFPTQAVRAMLEDELVNSWRARFGTAELERVEMVAKDFELVDLVASVQLLCEDKVCVSGAAAAMSRIWTILGGAGRGRGPGPAGRPPHHPGVLRRRLRAARPCHRLWRLQRSAPAGRGGGA